MTKASALQKVETLSRKIEKSETSLEAWKWQRAEAMAAAADAGATQREIGNAAGMAGQKAGIHIRIWNRYGSLAHRPTYSKAHEDVSGLNREKAQERTDRARTKKYLSELPLEAVEQVVSELPRERQRAIGAVAGNEYLKARQDYSEGEASLTPAQRKAREATSSSIETNTNKMVAAFGTGTLIDHIETATEMLREQIEQHAVIGEMLPAVGKALERLQQEYEVACAMAGLEVQS